MRRYGAVFYDGTPETQYELWPGTIERLMPTAFDRALRDGDDARSLFNHDPNILLARVGSGTLKLHKDKRGLIYEYEIDWRDPDHVAVAYKIDRGDLTGSSFSFSVAEPGVRWREEKDMLYREIHEFSYIHDVGPVTYPAYEGTQVAVRTAEQAGVREAQQDWLDLTQQWDDYSEEQATARIRRILQRAKKIRADSLDTD